MLVKRFEITGWKSLFECQVLLALKRNLFYIAASETTWTLLFHTNNEQYMSDILFDFIEKNSLSTMQKEWFLLAQGH